MRKRKVVKSNSLLHEKLKTASWKYLECERCHSEVEVESDAIKVICSMCIQKRIPPDPRLLAQKQPKDATSTKPRGWRFMKEFVDSDGTVYHEGEEQPKLKGTLPITDVASIKAKQKIKSKERKKTKEQRELKKMEKLAKQYKKKKKLKKEFEEQKSIN